jgi:glutaminyl-tRNA synthetase
MLYDRLFTIENVNAIPEDKTYNDYLNPDSLTVVSGAKVEPSLYDAKAGEKFQFVRDGYYCKDTKHENTFNRVVGLKDSFPAKK